MNALVRMLWMLGASIVMLGAGLQEPAATPAALTLRFTAQTTDGRTVTLPDVTATKPQILVVGFTQRASDEAARWTQGLGSGLSTRATVVGVAVLDRVPRFARAFVKRAISKQIGPPPAGGPGFVTTFDARELRATAPQGDGDAPVLYIIASSGAVTITRATVYSTGAEHSIEQTVR